MKKLIEDYEINCANIKEFELMYPNGRYKCCLCKRVTFIDESYSNRGDRLICHTCFWNKFENTENAHKWIRRKI